MAGTRWTRCTPGFVFKLRIGAFPFNLENDFLEPAYADGIRVHHFNFPVLTLRITRIHAIQVGGKDGRFFPARPGADFDKDILFIARVFGNQHQLELFLEYSDAWFQVGNFRLGQLAHFRVFL